MTPNEDARDRVEAQADESERHGLEDDGARRSSTDDGPPLGATDRNEAPEVDLLGKPPPDGRHNWDHRRAEPRMLALVWTVYLFVATLLMFASAGLLGFVTADSYRPSAKALLLLIFVGATVFWPMLRLTQLPPRKHIARETFKDVLVIVLPAQAIIWPQVFLAHWPFGVLLTATVALCGWTALGGALLARALDGLGPSRSGWMLIFLAMGSAAPVLIVLRAALDGGLDNADHVRWLWMGSPWTVPFELTRDREWTGSAAVVLPGHRVAAWITLAVGLAAWFVPRSAREETRPSAD